jgi:hypothetical protein
MNTSLNIYNMFNTKTIESLLNININYPRVKQLNHFDRYYSRQHR